jgi:predicted nuclease with RNAse H fold
MSYAGIDLAASTKRQTGLCILDKNVITKIVFTDSQILKEIKRARPKVVAIDAPLFLPIGRKDLRKSPIHLRSCDRELLKMRIKFFPISLGPMRALTKRGMQLKSKLERLGTKVIETYPGAVYDILGINRKKPQGLRKFIEFNPKGKSTHEIDAIACAYIARLYDMAKAKKIGKKREGYMYIP